MAHDESDREDFLREATALVERIELIVARTDSPSSRVVTGFRADGALSVFFDDDPVYQFNAVGELRRAYVNGLLFKAVRGRLASLTRVRQLDRVELQRHDLTDEEQSTFVQTMLDRIRQLDEVLSSGKYKIVGQVPLGADVIGRVKIWLRHRKNWPIAATPRA